MADKHSLELPVAEALTSSIDARRPGYDPAVEAYFDRIVGELRAKRAIARDLLKLAERSAEKAGVGMPASERSARQSAYQAAVRGFEHRDQAATDYVGVVVETAGERLAVRLDGSAFLFQTTGGVSWSTEFEHRYLANVVEYLSPRLSWSLAASAVPSYQSVCVDMIAAGDLPLSFIDIGGALCWLVRSDELGW